MALIRSQERGSNKMMRWTPLIILVVALGVRILILSNASREEVLFGTLTSEGLRSGDEGINIAKSLLLKGRFADPFSLSTGPSAHVSPAFPAITSLVFGVFGMGLAGAVARNAINIAAYSTLFATLPAAAEALALGRNAGILAGFAGALYPAFRSSEVFRGRDEALAALVLMWLTVLAFRLSSKGHLGRRSAWLFGAAWGGLMYVQPSTITIFPLQLLVATLSAKRNSLISRLHYVVIVGVAMTLVVLPWTIRNRLVLGGWMFMRDNLGLELRVSNDNFAQASLAANQATKWYCSVHPICSTAVAQEVRRVGELEFNRRALRNTVEWIRQHPADFRRLTVKRIAYFWTDLPSQPMTFAFRTALSLMGFTGVVLMWRHGLGRQAALFGAAYLMYPLTYYVVQFSNRYVAVIAFAFFLPAGFATSRIWTATSQARGLRPRGVSEYHI